MNSLPYAAQATACRTLSLGTWRFHARLALAAGLLVFGSFSGLCQSFLIDSNQSTITIKGDVLGNELKAQVPGSLTTKYTGTIQAVINDGTIQFSGGSSIQALNSGNWEPKSDGSAGSEPANYGGTASAGFATANAALRNLRVDVLSSAVTVNASQFDARGLTFLFLTNTPPGSFAYRVTGLLSQSGTNTLTGYATNGITDQGSWASSGGSETLILPVNATFKMELLSPDDTTIELRGQLVATRTAGPPPLKLQPVKIAKNSLTLQWQGQASDAFKIYSSSNLLNWETNVPSLTPTNGTYRYTLPVDSPARFIRISK